MQHNTCNQSKIIIMSHTQHLISLASWTSPAPDWSLICSYWRKTTKQIAKCNNYVTLSEWFMYVFYYTDDSVFCVSVNIWLSFQNDWLLSDDINKIRNLTVIQCNLLKRSVQCWLISPKIQKCCSPVQTLH